jgi:hypothetical protein
MSPSEEQLREWSNLSPPVSGAWPHDSIEVVWRCRRPDGGWDITMTFPPVGERIRLISPPSMRRTPQQDGHELIQVHFDFEWVRP